MSIFTESISPNINSISIVTICKTFASFKTCPSVYQNRKVLSELLLVKNLLLFKPVFRYQKMWQGIGVQKGV